MTLSVLFTPYSGTQGSPYPGPDRYRTLNGLFCRFAFCQEHHIYGLSRAALLIALFFGGFQTGITVLGRVAGISVIGFISAYDHWIAFILLLVVGGNVMGEGLQGEEKESRTDILRIVPLIALSLVTSINALTVGISFGVLLTAVLVPALIIGIVCGSISFAGVMLGEQLEDIPGNKMEIAGGLILILISVKILAEHLFTGKNHIPALPATLNQGADSGKKDGCRMHPSSHNLLCYQTSGNAMLV